MRKPTKGVLAVIVFVAMAGGPLWAESAEEIVKDALKTIEKTKSLACDMEVSMSLMGQEATGTGSMKAMSGGRTSSDITLTMTVEGKESTIRMRVVSNGKVAYSVVDGMGLKMAWKVDLGKLGVQEGGAGQVGGMMAMLDPDSGAKLKLLRSDKMTDTDGEEVWVIEGKAVGDAVGPGVGASLGTMLKAQMARSRVYIGKKTKMLRRIEFLAKKGDELTGYFEYSNIKLNEGVTEADFDFKPPEGVPVIDMTTLVRGQIGAAEAKRKKALAKEQEEEWTPSAMLKAGTEAPALKLKTLDGGTFDLARQRGKRVLVFFWASWQKDSVEMLEKVSKIKSTGLEVIAVSLDEPGESKAVSAMLKKRGLTTRAAMAVPKVCREYKVSEVPSYVLIDGNGKVIVSEPKPGDILDLEKRLAAPAKGK